METVLVRVDRSEGEKNGNLHCSNRLNIYMSIELPVHFRIILFIFCRVNVTRNSPRWIHFNYFILFTFQSIRLKAQILTQYTRTPSYMIWQLNYDPIWNLFRLSKWHTVDWWAIGVDSMGLVPSSNSLYVFGLDLSSTVGALDSCAAMWHSSVRMVAPRTMVCSVHLCSFVLADCPVPWALVASSLALVRHDNYSNSFAGAQCKW